VKNIRKHVILALSALAPSLAFALPPNTASSGINVYINGNLDNAYNPNQQSQGVFISSNANPSPYYNNSGNFSGEFKMSLKTPLN